MNRLSKRADTTFLILSVLALFISALLVLNTEQILTWLPGFLQDKIFHRTFNIEKYKDTMVSLILFPIFITIVLDAVLFVKMSDRNRCILLICYLVVVTLSISIISYMRIDLFIDSDLSTETMLAKECFEHKTFWPTSWCYSTEIRLLHTQLLTAPLFFFTDNLRLIHSITIFLCELILVFSTLFLLIKLNVKKWWIRLLGMLLIASPISATFFFFLHEGCYYVPHVAFIFIYIGLFLSVAFDENNCSRKKKHVFLFYVIAFLSGLSTIRYILNFTFPLFAILFLSRLFQAFKKHTEFSGFKEIAVSVWQDEKKENRPLFYASLGLVFSVVGYLLNSTVLASIFTFWNITKMQLKPLSEIKFDSIVSTILKVIGYNDGISVFTPGGISTILLTVVMIFTVYLLIKLYKNPNNEKEKAFIAFIIFMAIFNSYTIFCTELEGRYFITIFIFFVPFLALLMQFRLSDVNLRLPVYLLAICSSILILTNTFLCVGNMATGKSIGTIGELSNFLANNGYEFGYTLGPSVKDANSIWFLTNGRIEIVTVESEKVGNVQIVPSQYQMSKWLVSKRYEDVNYYKGGKPIFFALLNDQYNNSDKHVFESGKLIYSDEEYIVFEYKTPSDFIKAFD